MRDWIFSDHDAGPFPPDGTYCLVFSPGFSRAQLALRFKGGWEVFYGCLSGTSIWMDSDDDGSYISHWMPLPENPA